MLRRRPLARMAVRTTVIAGTAAAVGAHAASKSAASAQPVPAVDASAGPSDTSVDTVDQLTKLAALKDAGVLTQAEFDAQKAKLLA